MITQNNPSMNSAAESIFISNTDFAIRERCREIEDAIIHENYMKEQITNLTKKNETLTSEIAALASENTALNDEITRLKKILKEKH